MMAMLQAVASIELMENFGSKTDQSKNIIPGHIFSPVNQSSDQLIIEVQEGITPELDNLGVRDESTSILEPSAICTTNPSSGSPLNNIYLSKAKFIQELNEWGLKYDIQPNAFRDLLVVLCTYYPELDLQKEFEGSKLLECINSEEKKKLSSNSKRRLSSAESSIADTEVFCEDEHHDHSEQPLPAPKASKRRRMPSIAEKRAEFCQFKEELLKICQSELRQVCQDEFSKWNQECHSHIKIVKGMATDLKHVKEELKSVKNMMPLVSKPAKR